MRRLYEAGLHSFRDIAVLHGCGKNTIRQRLLEVGVVPDVAQSLRVKAVGRPSARKGAKWTEETHKRWRASREGMVWGGRVGPHSDETKRKISEVIRARPKKYTDEQRRDIERVRQACKRFIHRVLKATGKRKDLRSAEHVGYTTDQLVARLGPRPTDAHIDHYVPIAEFLKRGIRSPMAINALVNLRWLSADANRRKSARVPDDADAVIAACLEAEAAYSAGLP